MIIRLKFILSLVIGLFVYSNSLASHFRGGEISWKCNSNGQFIFQLSFYRDCNGVVAPTSLTLSTTVPGVPTIFMTKISLTDISNQGYQSNGITPCIDCSQGGAPGLIQKHVYESGPVTLSGVPPPTGWMFYWGECCRNNLLDNIASAGSIGFRLRAFMYPYNGQNTSSCFDNSPVFVEKPTIHFCTSIQQQYSFGTHDVDGDSLVYSWANPIDDNGATINYAPGYSMNSPLPSSNQNPNNQAVSLNSLNGLVTYLGYTGGNFNTVVKVTSYRQGWKISEVFRETDVVINNNCPPTGNGTLNAPPLVSAPFQNPVTGQFTEYSKTVNAGDTVNFSLTFQDFNIFTNGVPQNITVEAAGGIFGTNFTNAGSGCDVPPCAVLSSPMPVVVPIAGNLSFSWVTSVNHLAGFSVLPAVFYFNLKFSDNYCPANASVTKTITINIYPPAIFEPPVLRCASVNNDGSVILNWSPTITVDSLGLFLAYTIHASQDPTGPFQQAAVVTGINSSTYTQSATSLFNMFGINANQQPIYYYIRSHSIGQTGGPSLPSNALATVKLNCVIGPTNNAELNWNVPSTPPLGSSASKFYIYKKINSGIWTLTDSTSANTWNDNTTPLLCNDTVYYRVSLGDTTGCTHVSSVANVVINDPVSLSAISPSNPTICNAIPVTLTAHFGQSYLWTTGATTQTISVSSTGTYSVTITQPGGCTTVATTTVNSGSAPTPVITSGANAICYGVNLNLNAGSGYSAYLWNTGATTQVINISPGSTTTYTVTVTAPNGCTGSAMKTIVVNPLPAPIITGVTTICQGQTTVLNGGGPYSNYVWNTGHASQAITIGWTGIYTVTVSDANGCTGSDDITITVNPLPTPSIVGDLDICTGDTTILNAGQGYMAYLWSSGLGVAPSATVWMAGTYTVTVTNAFGCSGSTSVAVTSGPIFSLPPTYAFCSGTSITLAPGVFSTYLWSTGEITPSIEVLFGGTYTVSVTDVYGCTGVATTVVTENLNPFIILNGIALCQGTVGTLDAGPFWMTYLWSTSQTSQTIPVGSSGIYTVTITDINGCTGSDSALVTVNSLPNVTATAAGPTAFCVGDSLLLSATTGYPSYLWYRYNNPVQPNNTTPDHYVKTQGRYYCRITDANGCTKNTNKIFIEPPCIPIGGAGEKAPDEITSMNISVMPNPSYDQFMITTDFAVKILDEIIITDLLGKQVSHRIEKLNDYEFIIHDLPKGIFLMKIKNQHQRLVRMD